MWNQNLPQKTQTIIWKYLIIYDWKGTHVHQGVTQSKTFHVHNARSFTRLTWTSRFRRRHDVTVCHFGWRTDAGDQGTRARGRQKDGRMGEWWVYAACRVKSTGIMDGEHVERDDDYWRKMMWQKFSPIFAFYRFHAAQTL